MQHDTCMIRTVDMRRQHEGKGHSTETDPGGNHCGRWWCARQLLDKFSGDALFLFCLSSLGKNLVVRLNGAV